VRAIDRFGQDGLSDCAAMRTAKRAAAEQFGAPARRLRAGAGREEWSGGSGSGHGTTQVCAGSGSFSHQ